MVGFLRLCLTDGQPITHVILRGFRRPVDRLTVATTRNLTALRARKADFRVYGPGKIKWYSAKLGYGFILTYDEGLELLMRREDVFESGLQTLKKNTQVTYEAVERMEGPEAKNVYKV